MSESDSNSNNNINDNINDNINGNGNSNNNKSYTVDDLKCYNDCCEYYSYVLQMSNNYDITFEEVENIFSTLLCENMICMYQGIEEINSGIEFYKSIFNKQKNISSYNEIINVMRYQFVENYKSPYLESKYNLVGFCMKIISHIMWKLCYVYAPRLHSNPEDAIRDILYPLEASHREMKIIFNLLEKESGLILL